LTTVSELAEFQAVRKNYPGLRQAALSLASPQLRHLGTVGGNLCQRPRCWYYRDGSVHCRKKGGSRCFAFTGRSKYHAILGGSGCFIVHPSDLAPMLIALGASVQIQGPKNEKRIPLEDFFQPPGADVRKENILDKDQFVSGVLLPKAQAFTHSCYVKYRERGAWDFALVSAAAVGQKNGDYYRNLRLVLGGVAPVPWRLKEAERMLDGRPLTEESIGKAAAEELKKARVLKDNAYKLDLIPQVIKDSLHGMAG